MHLNSSQASLLLHRLQERIKIHRDVEVVLAPSMLTLQPLSMQLDRRKFRLAAQNAYHKDEGAFTGEVAINMLRDLVHYVIVGHSERRHVFGETSDETAQKVAACIRNEVAPILCVGETQQERLEGETKQVLHDQLMVGLSHVTSSDIEDIVIAYEPVWAISSGNDYGNHESAKPDQIKEAVDVIKNNLKHMFGKQVAEKVRILYGGSTTADNARAFLEVDGISGVLVGGASLNYHQFADIVEAGFRYAQSQE